MHLNFIALHNILWTGNSESQPSGEYLAFHSSVFDISGSIKLCLNRTLEEVAKWRAFNDESIDIYPGEVQYYFEHTLRLSEGPRTHLLAYVK